jgi:hypothetical protein
MRTLLIKLFINNWQRKLISLILAMIIWMVVNHTLTVSKTIHDIPIRVTNIPKGKTVEGLQSNGFLNKRLSLNLSGNKNLIEQLNSNNLEILIDAANKKSEWVVAVGKENLHCKNTNIILSRELQNVQQIDLILRLSQLVKEQIPIIVTEPIGEAPRGYQFNDIFPYHLYLTTKGPEDVIKRLKTKGLKLTFNLNEITKDDLEHINLNPNSEKADEISYKVPTHWKKIMLPSLSDKFLIIDDPKAKNLRINFLKSNLIPIQGAIPITLYYQEKHCEKINPNTYKLSSNDFIKDYNGLKVITTPLYAKNVSKMFLDAAKGHIQIVVIAAPRNERKNLLWNVQFINPNEIENHYIAKVLAQKNHEMNEITPKLREEYLRNRFRNYMQRFRLFSKDDEKLALKIELNTNTVDVIPANETLIANDEKTSSNPEELTEQ